MSGWDQRSNQDIIKQSFTQVVQNEAFVFSELSQLLVLQ